VCAAAHLQMQEVREHVSTWTLAKQDAGTEHALSIE
jgi:hypothetical protein